MSWISKSDCQKDGQISKEGIGWYISPVAAGFKKKSIKKYNLIIICNRMVYNGFGSFPLYLCLHKFFKFQEKNQPITIMFWDWKCVYTFSS